MCVCFSIGSSCHSFHFRIVSGKLQITSSHKIINGWITTLWNIHVHSIHICKHVNYTPAAVNSSCRPPTGIMRCCSLAGCHLNCLLHHPLCKCKYLWMLWMNFKMQKILLIMWYVLLSVRMKLLSWNHYDQQHWSSETIHHILPQFAMLYICNQMNVNMCMKYAICDNQMWYVCTMHKQVVCLKLPAHSLRHPVTVFITIFSKFYKL